MFLFGWPTAQRKQDHCASGGGCSELGGRGTWVLCFRAKAALQKGSVGFRSEGCEGGAFTEEHKGNKPALLLGRNSASVAGFKSVQNAIQSEKLLK